MPSTPVPFVVEPSSHWSGNDGSWSTFLIGVGTPRQYFDVLPSTISSEVWVPVPQGCTWIPSSVLPDCGASRGVQAESGPGSLGFLTNNTKTWDQIGLYQLGSEQNLYGQNESGLYGRDTVGYGGYKSAYQLPEQLVAGIATQDFWIGSLGLGYHASQFDVVSSNISSLLPAMKNSSFAPSISYGYTAGASYSTFPGRPVRCRSYS